MIGQATTTVRPGTPADAEACGQIFWDAFHGLAQSHGFPTEPSSPEFTGFRARQMLEDPGFHALVAERDGRVVASNFIDERSTIAGIGPLTVAPGEQDSGAGRMLMEAAMERSRERGAVGVRLVQTAYHYRSLALYAKLGFVVREPLAVVQGGPLGIELRGYSVRAAQEGDLAAADALCRRVHGHDRDAELRDAIGAGTASVVERDGRLGGYATGFGYGWHAVGETSDDIKALLGSAEQFMGLGVLVPARNAGLLRWCLDNGLQVVQQSTLMSTGLYNEPGGAWLPSILF
jgi:predicted N-acetyltransferase YhbS